jgi:hypothetical protein
MTYMLSDARKSFFNIVLHRQHKLIHEVISSTLCPNRHYLERFFVSDRTRWDGAVSPAF